MHTASVIAPFIRRMPAAYSVADSGFQYFQDFLTIILYGRKIFQNSHCNRMPAPQHFLKKQIKALTGTSKTGAGMFDFCGP